MWMNRYSVKLLLTTFFSVLNNLPNHFFSGGGGGRSASLITFIYALIYQPREVKCTSTCVDAAIEQFSYEC